MNPRIAPRGIMAMIIAGRRLLVAGEFDGALLVDMEGFISFADWIGLNWP